MHIDPGPNNPKDQEGNGGSLLTLILAVIISVAIVSFIMSTSRRHAAALDEGIPPTAAAPAFAPTQPAPAP